MPGPYQTRREFLTQTAATTVATIASPSLASTRKSSRAAPASDGKPSRLEPDDLFDLRFLRDARLSPDGTRAAYCISMTEDHSTERFEIWIVHIANGKHERLPYSGNARNPRWSPDGRSLAFVGDGRLYVAEGSRMSPPLTPDHLSVQGAPSWSPDNERLAASLLERTPSKGPRWLTNDQYRADGIGFLDAFHQHIYEVNRSTRALRCLTSGAGRVCTEPEWSACGRRILFFASNDAVPFASYSPELLTIELEGGAITRILDERWFVTDARWLPDGERIAVAAARDSTLTIPNPRVWVVDRAGNAELRTPDLIGNVGCRINHDMPARDLLGGNMLTVLDSQTAFVSIQRGGSVEIWRIALDGDIALRSVLTGDRSCIVLDANAEANSLLFATTDLRRPPELKCASLDRYREQQLTGLNDAVTAQWSETDLQQFTFKTNDALQIDAWFMAPANLKKPLPTVLFIHSGPFGATGHAFRYDFLLLASRGFGIVFANFRGSAGYGDSFSRAIMGDWGGKGFPDHMATIDAAIARRWADPQRLGVWGPSHGGFATCWVVGHTNRFKAAIAEAAITNFATTYYLTDAPDSFARDLGGRPHEIPDVYRDRSPITYAHRCRTPTLLIHGEADLRCPISEAEQFHRALRDVDCVCELLRLPGGSHLGDSIGPVDIRLAQNQALVTWFEHYLRV